MRGNELLRTTVAFVLLVLLHFSLRPLLGWRASPDFLVLALLLLAIRVRPGSAAIVGFLLGLVYDSLTGQAFGATSLGLSIIGFAGSWLKAVFFADDVLLNTLFFFLGKWVFDFIFLMVQHRLSATEMIVEQVVWGTLRSAVTALFGLALLVLLRPLLRSSAT